MEAGQDASDFRVLRERMQRGMTVCGDPFQDQLDGPVSEVKVLRYQGDVSVNLGFSTWTLVLGLLLTSWVVFKKSFAFLCLVYFIFKVERL